MAQKNSQLIGPISGFPEYLPAQQRAFDAIAGRIRAVYERFGYTPLETAAVERIQVIESKGIDAKEVYALRRLAAQQGTGDDDTTGAKELALRFDLTVPTARYVAQHYGQLVFPFRRHQIQPVWRGERPQKGRYRQFYQCDIDYIADGPGKLPLAADAEILACAATALASLELEFTMRVNNRKLLLGLLAQYGLGTAEMQRAALKIVDDLEKLPAAVSLEKLSALTPHAADLLAVLRQEAPVAVDDLTREGWEELQQVHALVQQQLQLAKLPEHAQVVLDFTIARGLDYYTGTVAETTLKAAPELGSICSGGRYENLAESLSDRALPGVGISIGLSRLATWLMDRDPWASGAATPAQVYVGYGLGAVAAELRADGVAVEEGLLEEGLGKQLMTAEKRGHRWAVVGAAEPGKYNLRHIPTRADTPLSVAQIALRLRDGQPKA